MPQRETLPLFTHLPPTLVYRDRDQSKKGFLGYAETGKMPNTGPLDECACVTLWEGGYTCTKSHLHSGIKLFIAKCVSVVSHLLLN